LFAATAASERRFLTNSAVQRRTLAGAIGQVWIKLMP